MRTATLTSRAAPAGLVPGRACLRGAVLLEVVLALTLLVSAGAIIGMGLQKSIRTAGQISDAAQAADLAVTLVSQLQMGLVERAAQGPVEYAEPMAEWTWQITAEPLADIQGLQCITVTVTHTTTKLAYSLAEWMPVAVASSDAATTEADSTSDPAGGVP